MSHVEDVSDFLARDSQNAAKVAILNEFAARTYFANTNPIGKRIGNIQAAIEAGGSIRPLLERLRALEAEQQRVCEAYVTAREALKQ